MKNMFDDALNGGMNIYLPQKKYYRGKKISIEVTDKKSTYFNLDGEIYQAPKITIEVVSN
jgi:diacylglycerol kinase family enzyme